MENFPPLSSNPPAVGRATPADDSAQKAGNTLRHELSELKSDLDALMSHEATLSDGELSEAYARILARLGAASAVARIAAHEVEPHQHAGPSALERARERPMQALAAASAAGALVGWLTQRAQQRLRHH